MPWTCCGASVLDNRQACPACGQTKASWTVKYRKTTVFRIGKGAFVEVELVDDSGEPVAGQRFLVRAADGSEVRGQLDDAGYARVDLGRVGSGKPCTVVFLDLDFERPAWQEEPPAPPDVALEAPRGFIEVELVDSDGRPVAHEPFVLVLPDGRELAGALDEAGFARVGELPEGAVTVRFPERDFAAPAPAEPPALAAHALEVAQGWVEVELVDSDGRPVAHEPFVLVLPDGSERRGLLDDDGRARVGELPEGAVTVRFPERDFAAPAPVEPSPPALPELALA